VIEKEIITEDKLDIYTWILNLFKNILYIYYLFKKKKKKKKKKLYYFIFIKIRYNLYKEQHINAKLYIYYYFQNYVLFFYSLVSYHITYYI